MTAFPWRGRMVFNGSALAIMRSKPGQAGRIRQRAGASGLAEVPAVIESAD